MPMPLCLISIKQKKQEHVKREGKRMKENRTRGTPQGTDASWGGKIKPSERSGDGLMRA